MTDAQPPRFVLARVLHAVVALAAIVGVSMEVVTALTSDDPGTRIVRVLSYFTIQANIVAAIPAVLMVLRPDRSGRFFAVLRLDGLLCIAVTGIVFHTVLTGLRDLTPAGAVSNFLLHTVTPVFAVLAWLLVGPRPRTTLAAVGWSIVYPLAWVAYTFVHGAIVDWYPYPFLDVSEIGLADALVRTGVVAVIFLALAFGALALERVLPPAPRPVTATT
ncbi:Pr6Pr family membrane protein [Cellulomonas sp. P5_C6]